MCGIAGCLNLLGGALVEESRLRRMLAAIRHRGPDEFGIYAGTQVGLGSARLSIVDLSSGQQPISNEDETLWIVFNGEIFNHVELRPELEARGCRFTTSSDTEVLLYMYQEYGAECLNRLNGQFAAAIWNTGTRTLFLARDRLGVRPLFYTIADGALIFASEIKAILADGRVRARIDPVALDQIFTFWSALSPRTAFQGIREVPPGHYVIARGGEVNVRRYWQLSFAHEPQRAEKTDEDYLDEFRELLADATRIRLRADVPVGAYLSGGLDSSAISAIARKLGSNRLDTFSITFSDPQFDESEFQMRMARFLGTEHRVAAVSHADLGRVFPEVIWHTETPVMRTSPAPMFLLSKLVHEHGLKVVLTGEGADEFLGGYDIFKEAALRRFWARQPGSLLRPALLRRLYSDIPGLGAVNSEYLGAFFRPGLTDLECPYYSHAIRWRNNRRTRRFFSTDLAAEIAREGADAVRAIDYPDEFRYWGPLERAQYLESTVFLSQYLLSSQSDRVAMAHSVEGRFPFLDHRVVGFCCRLPSRLKLNGLREKWLLKNLGRELLPNEIWRRPKRPYRAPIHRSFFHGTTTPEYVRELLSRDGVNKSGLFNAAAVSALAAKLERGEPVGETDDMGLAGILSAQLVVHQFISSFRAPRPLDARDRVKLCLRKEAAAA